MNKTKAQKESFVSEGKSMEGGNRGEFFTPKAILRVMESLIEPVAGTSGIRKSVKRAKH